MHQATDHPSMLVPPLGAGPPIAGETELHATRLPSEPGVAFPRTDAGPGMVPFPHWNGRRDIGAIPPGGAS
ncbi:protein of unknown function [Rhodovastum atsumiense]|nr:protein of unknown function [Rhodovastum atsumiense]